MMNFFILVLFCRSQARRINKPRRSNIAVCFSLTALCVVRVCVCVCIKFFNKEVYRCWCSQIFFDVSQESEISPGVRLARRERTAAAFSHTPPLWYKCKIFFCLCVLAVRAREREKAPSQLSAGRSSSNKSLKSSFFYRAAREVKKWIRKVGMRRLQIERIE